MKTIKKNVYYCDFCNKKGLSASHISIHEKHCTANPKRICRTCEANPDIDSYIQELKKRFEIIETPLLPCDQYDMIEGAIERTIKWIGEPIKLNEILNHVENCPNCTLAILRLTKLNYNIFGFNFNYKKALDEWWGEINNERENAERYY